MMGLPPALAHFAHGRTIAESRASSISNDCVPPPYGTSTLRFTATEAARVDKWVSDARKGA